MKLIKAFETNSGKGNCLSAALSSLLEINTSEIPSFHNMKVSEWKQSLVEWGATIGVDIKLTHAIPGGFCIGIGIKHDVMSHHAVILHNGAYYFDTGISDTFYDEHRYCIEVIDKRRTSGQ